MSVLDGKVAIITGGTSGIGERITEPPERRHQALDFQDQRAGMFEVFSIDSRPPEA
jgi:NADP-dependent 3-hydroxy acid dehydrogenase YdfG